MINIAKLLKDAPKGMKLYSPLLGEVEFAEVMDTGYMPIRVMKRGYGLRFDKYGRYMGNEYPDAECVLFPSKEVRTWEGWKLPAQPNFKVGDWIACIDDEGDVAIEKIVCFVHNKVLLVDVDGCFTEYPKTELSNFHLWSIADAKDGDVLAFDWAQDDGASHWEKIVIFKKYHAKGVKGVLNSPCVEGYGNTFKNGKLVLQEEVPYYSKTWTMTLQPATREQRDLLFAKMLESGYEWDAEKKGLRKIFEPKFKVGDDIKTGSTIETIAEIDYTTRSYSCESGRTIWFENQDMWYLAPKPHYDIINFHEGMPVLVRNGDCLEWEYVTFSHYRKVGTPFCAGGQYWFQCIPFSEDTKHLLGTIDPCDERYINW